MAVSKTTTKITPEVKARAVKMATTRDRVVRIASIIRVSPSELEEWKLDSLGKAYARNQKEEKRLKEELDAINWEFAVYLGDPFAVPEWMDATS